MFFGPLTHEWYLVVLTCFRYLLYTLSFQKVVVLFTEMAKGENSCALYLIIFLILARAKCIHSYAPNYTKKVLL